MARKARVAFVNTHPIQYFAPLYAYLNASDDVAVTAIYLSDFSVRGGHDRAFGLNVKWDIDLLSGYEARFVAGADRRDEPAGFFSMLAPDVWRQIARSKFDAVIVHGHTPAAQLVAIAAARASNARVFMRNETHLGLSRSGVKRALRRPVLRSLYGLCDGVFAIGSANAAFYAAMGVPPERIFAMPYTVDNERFTRHARMTSNERRAMRESLGVTDDLPIVLYAAKFQARKRPADLLKAAARLRSEGFSFHVAMVGSGELHQALVDLARTLGLDNVSFQGFVNQSMLPRVYAACDVFVLPSENEPWGLAVNEAMCAGLPVVVSRDVGCAEDLVDDLNGRTYAAGDVQGLADALRPLLSSADTRCRLGDASRAKIERWSYAECRAGLMQALVTIPSRRPALNS